MKLHAVPSCVCAPAAAHKNSVAATWFLRLQSELRGPEAEAHIQPSKLSIQNETEILNNPFLCGFLRSFKPYHASKQTCQHSERFSNTGIKINKNWMLWKNTKP